jgi:hypothetical protein
LIYHIAALFLAISTLVMVGEGLVKSIGYVFLFFAFVTIFLFVVSKAMQLKLVYDQVAIFFFAYLCICIFGIDSLASLKFLSGIAFYLMVYLSGLCFNGRLLSKAIYSNSLLYLVIISVYSLISTSSVYSFIFNNPNALALLLFVFSFFILYESKSHFIKVFSTFLILFLIFKTGSRAVLVGFLFFISIVYMPWVLKVVNPRKIFLMTFGILVLLCCAYALSKGTDIGNMLNGLSHQYFEKNLYSGRQEVWLKMYNSIGKVELIMGKGTGLSASMVTDKDLSAHNSFFQIIFQNGIAGLVCVISVLYFSLPKEVLNKEEVIKSAFIIAILFPASFEVFIFQNHTVISMYLTIILFQMKGEKNHAKDFSKKIRC